MNEDEIKRYKRALKDHQISDTKITTFCRLTPEQRAKIGFFDGDKAKLNELEKAIKAMPLITATGNCFVKDEKVITAPDVITFEIVIKYDLFEPTNQPGWVCAKRFPFLKHHNWYIIFCDGKIKENVIQMEKIKAKETDGNVVKFEMKQRIGAPGTFKFFAIIMNDSYVGFDTEVELNLEIAASDPDRVVPPVHKEDLLAVKGPNALQSLLDVKVDDSDGGDQSSEDGTEALVQKLKKAGLEKATEKRSK